MRDLDLTNLRLFVAVCDHRNIVRAAGRTNGLAAVEIDAPELTPAIRESIPPRRNQSAGEGA